MNLQSLDLSGTKITLLPDTIRELTDLTFLNISRTAITELPNSIKDKQLLDINVFETVLHQKDELKILSQNIYSQRFEEIREIFKAAYSENEEYDIQVFTSDDIFH